MNFTNFLCEKSGLSYNFNYDLYRIFVFIRVYYTQYIYILMFQFCDTHLEVPLTSMNMFHLELTPESLNIRVLLFGDIIFVWKYSIVNWWLSSIGTKYWLDKCMDDRIQLLMTISIKTEPKFSCQSRISKELFGI